MARAWGILDHIDHVQAAVEAICVLPVSPCHVKVCCTDLQPPITSKP